MSIVRYSANTALVAFTALVGWWFLGFAAAMLIAFVVAISVFTG